MQKLHSWTTNIKATHNKDEMPGIKRHKIPDVHNKTGDDTPDITRDYIKGLSNKQNWYNTKSYKEKM